jgi:5-methylthioadenosine/S-adenosylhomocysteine deaminase
VRVDEDDVAAIARSGSAVAHCPASNAKLGHGIAPLREMLDAGIHVGLGSDSMASNNRMDLLEEARLAAFMQRVRSGTFHALSAARALELATIGGAQALGIAERVGSLEPGKDADIAAFDLRAPPGVPAYDAVSAAVFALGGQPARLVTVAGDVRVSDWQLRDHDPALAERVRDTAAMLRAVHAPVLA